MLRDGIRTYPGEIRQVFTTLLLNAIEAVDAGGTIDVRARKASHWQTPAIQGVRVNISDNGVGISATNIRRIFEPFFTTKGENGTGLGLWLGPRDMGTVSARLALEENPPHVVGPGHRARSLLT